MEKTDEQEKATNFALKYLEHLIEKELDSSTSSKRSSMPPNPPPPPPPARTIPRRKIKRKNRMAMEKKVYVVPGCEVVYVRTERNFTQSQTEDSTIGDPLIPGGNGNRYYDPYHHVGE